LDGKQDSLKGKCKMKKMGRSPRVSVVIPLYNQKEFIGDAIQSVLGQSYKNIEIIVVNDGSTDNPVDVLSQYRNDIIEINQENRGLSGARNSGIRRAGGDYVQLLDADDLLTENKIERQLKYFRQGNSDLPYCRIQTLHNKKRIISERPDPVIKDMFSHYYLLWKPYPTPIHSLLFPMDIFRKHGLFDEEMKANEDRYFLAKLAISGTGFVRQDFTGGFYREHPSSMNADPLFMMEAMIHFYKVINKDLGHRFLLDKYKYNGSQMLRANCTFFYMFHIRKGTERKILKGMKEILKKHGVPLYADPLESRFRNGKLTKMKAACYYRRYMNTLKCKRGMSSGS